MRVIVTGGTGLLGNAVLRELNEAGHDSVALVRSPYDSVVFEGIDTEFVSGDLLDRDLITKVVQNCDAVIHAAGLIHLGWKRLQESMKVNSEGTQILVDACLQHGGKLIHIGTVNTLAVGTREQPANESTPYGNAGGQIPCSYVLSKRAGVEVVKKGVEQGLEAVILAPGFMLGPWDWKPSSGRMMLALSKGWKPIAPSGGCSVCDVRDVAAGHVLAMDKGRIGESYILANKEANMSNKEFLTLIGKIAGVDKVASKEISGKTMLRVARVAEFISKLTGKAPITTYKNSLFVMQHCYVDPSKAIEELGLPQTPIETAVRDSIAWFREHGYA